MPATPVWLAAAESMLNRNIDASATAAALAARLEGKSLQIEAGSFAPVRAGIHRARFVLGGAAPADAVIAGSPLALLRLFTAANASPASLTSPAAATRGAQIRGDAEVANQFRALLQRVRPNFEEELGRQLGVVPAHGIAKAASSFLSWGVRAANTARANIREYLQEESRALVNPAELDEYLRGVDGVREAADRAEARLRELERRLSREN